MNSDYTLDLTLPDYWIDGYLHDFVPGRLWSPWLKRVQFPRQASIEVAVYLDEGEVEDQEVLPRELNAAAKWYWECIKSQVTGLNKTDHLAIRRTIWLAFYDFVHSEDFPDIVATAWEVHAESQRWERIADMAEEQKIRRLEGIR